MAYSKKSVGGRVEAKGSKTAGVKAKTKIKKRKKLSKLLENFKKNWKKGAKGVTIPFSPQKELFGAAPKDSMLNGGGRVSAKKGGKITYKARGGEAGKGTIFKSDKPLPRMHRGTGPKISRKDTKKPTKSIKKTTTDKNKKLLDALAAVNKKIRERTDKQIENLIKKQKADKILVDDRFKHHVATRPSRVKDTRFTASSDKVSPKKAVASTDRKISTSRFKKGGQVGSGSAFVASLYK